MSEFPSLPLFTDAYLADTRHLTAQEHGAYLLLLMMAWRSPDCRLPDDDAKLAKWACVDARTWARIKPTIMEFWTPESGTWIQSRLAREREYVSKRAEVARENGKHGGRPKPLKQRGSDNPAGSARVPQAKAPNPNPSPIAAAQQSASEFFYDRLIKAASARGPCHPSLAMGIGPMTDLIARGYSEAEIIETITERAKPDIGSWKYFVPIIEQRARDRAAIAPKPEPATIDWRSRLDVFRSSQTWSANWGPKPGESGCQVPIELIQGQAA